MYSPFVYRSTSAPGIDSDSALRCKGDARKENSWIVLIRRVPAACVQARRGGSCSLPVKTPPGSPLFTSAGKVEREREKAISACHPNRPIVVCYVISVVTPVLRTIPFVVPVVLHLVALFYRSSEERSSPDEDDGEDLDAVRDLDLSFFSSSVLVNQRVRQVGST